MRAAAQQAPDGRDGPCRSRPPASQPGTSWPFTLALIPIRASSMCSDRRVIASAIARVTRMIRTLPPSVPAASVMNWHRSRARLAGTGPVIDFPGQASPRAVDAAPRRVGARRPAVAPPRPRTGSRPRDRKAPQRMDLTERREHHHDHEGHAPSETPIPELRGRLGRTWTTSSLPSPRAGPSVSCRISRSKTALQGRLPL